MQTEVASTVKKEGSLLSKRKAYVSCVTKRDGERQTFEIQKIVKRLERLAQGLNREYVNLKAVVDKVVRGLYDGIKTEDIDNLAAETCAYMNIVHPDYSQLAARIAVDNLHKETKESLVDTLRLMYENKDRTGKDSYLNYTFQQQLPCYSS